MSFLAATLSIVLSGWPVPRAVFANCPGPSTIVCGKPTTVDLSSVAPENAKAVVLSGILIISYPDAAKGTCEVLTYFRPDMYSSWGNYRGQVVETLPGGVRSTHSLTVPLSKNKTFDIWLVETKGQPTWPQGCAYGANYVVDQWIVE